MPLSEDEQRILSEIEAQLYQSDPALAEEIGSKTVYTDAFRRVRWSVVGLVVGLALLVGLLAVSHWLAFLGFLVMMASAFVLVRNMQRLGRVGWQQVTRSSRAPGLRDYFTNARERAGERLRRDDEE